MPGRFTPEAFVFQPRAPNQTDIGRSLQNLANTRLQDRQIKEQTAGRQDTNTRFAAQFAADRSAAEYQTALKRYERKRVLAAALGKASAANDTNTADILARQLQDAGGIVERGGTPEAPIYNYDIGESPSQGPMNIPGTRNEIFGNGGGYMGPTNMNGDPTANQFDRLPGMSAQMTPLTNGAPGIGPNPTPGGRQGPVGTQGFGNGLPPGIRPTGGAEAPPQEQAPTDIQLNPSQGPVTGGASGAALSGAGGAESSSLYAPQGMGGPVTPGQQLSSPAGRNPLDKFPLDTGLFAQRNRARSEPLLKGAINALPYNYQQNFKGAEGLMEGALSLNLGPEKTAELFMKPFGEVVRLLGSLERSRAQASSLQLQREKAGFAQNEQIKRNAEASVDKLVGGYEFKKMNQRYNDARAARNQLMADTNASDTAALRKLYSMYTSGVMTDKDFEQTKNGAVWNLWRWLQSQANEKFLAPKLDPEVRAELMNVIAVAERTQAQEFLDLQDRLMDPVESGHVNTDLERDVRVYRTSQYIPEPLWSDYVRQQMGRPVTGGGNGAGGGESESVTMRQSRRGAGPISPNPPGGRGADGLPTDNTPSPMTSLGKPLNRLTPAERDSLSTEELERLTGAAPDE